MDWFLLLKLLGNMALPPASMVLGLLVGGLLAVCGARRLARGIVVLSVLETAVLSAPPVAGALIAPLERQARALAQEASPCCYSAIVLLGGGVSPATPPWVPDLNLHEGADRMWHAAKLFKQGVAPIIIVSGGDVRTDQPSGNDTEADAMRQVLLSLGVPDEAIRRESASRNTGENIAFVKAMIGTSPVALVTSAIHMPRALRIARDWGLSAAAFPTDFQAPAEARPIWENWLPNAGALGASNSALWEYMALAFDRRKSTAPGTRLSTKVEGT